jgi:preprotein translocase subunit SecG
MFTTLILVVHIVVCIALILIILLQSGKGADIGAVFGGGSSQTVFGSTGATPFLSKVTIGAAVIFMVTSIILTYFSGKGAGVEKSIVSGTSGVEAPVQPGVPLPEPGKTDATAPKPEAGPVPPTQSAPAAVPAPAATESKPPAEPPSQAPAAPAPAAPVPVAPAPAAPAAESPSGQ